MPENNVRVIAPDVGGGFGSQAEHPARGLHRAAAGRHHRAAGQVDRGPQREPAEHRAWPRHGGLHRDRRASSDGTIRGVRGTIYANLGAYCRFFAAGLPVLAGPDAAGQLQDARLQGRHPRRLHQQALRRRLSRRGPPRGHLRHRAHRWTCWPTNWAWTRPSCAARTSCRKRGLALHQPDRPGLRQRQLRAHARQSAGDGRTTRSCAQAVRRAQRDNPRRPQRHRPGRLRGDRRAGARARRPKASA